MLTYQRATTIAAPPDRVFEWHSRPAAFERLSPPWQPAHIEARSGVGLEPGSTVTLRVKVGPFRLRWVAQHRDLIPGQMFSDRQIRGPFASWEHRHCFNRTSEETTELVDQVQYKLPFGWVGQLGTGYARGEIERLFAYRHRVTALDIGWHQRYQGQKMKVAITGSTGVIGSALCPFLESGGHTVVPLRRTSGKSDDAPSWNPTSGIFSDGALQEVGAVVHLAGENIAARRWTTAQKTKIQDSRVESTSRLCQALSQLAKPPKTLIVASAIGLYGDRGDENLTESSAPGTGFLAELGQAWEAACEPAQAAGIRVVHLRLGIVITPTGGALGRMLTPFRMGLGGPMGSGRQYMSWVTLDDVVASVLHALQTKTLTGPVNVVAPTAVTNAEFTKTLGHVLSRPTVFTIPSLALRLMFGEMADELLLASARVKPERLKQTGFVFGHPTLERALRHVLGRHELSNVTP